MKEIIRTAVNAFHEIDLVTVRWEYNDNFYEFALASVGWGTLLLFVRDGRPFVGLQISYGKLSVWLGPWYTRLGF